MALIQQEAMPPGRSLQPLSLHLPHLRSQQVRSRLMPSLQKFETCAERDATRRKGSPPRPSEVVVNVSSTASPPSSPSPRWPPSPAPLPLGALTACLEARSSLGSSTSLSHPCTVPFEFPASLQPAGGRQLACSGGQRHPVGVDTPARAVALLEGAVCRRHSDCGILAHRVTALTRTVIPGGRPYLPRPLTARRRHLIITMHLGARRELPASRCLMAVVPAAAFPYGALSKVEGVRKVSDGNPLSDE